MGISPLRNPIVLIVLVLAAVLAAVALSAPAPAAAPTLAPTRMPSPPPAAARATSTPQVIAQAPATALPPTHTPTATMVPPTPTPSVIPTPSPRPPGTLPRVGIQVGHWKSSELPDELARLRSSSGTFAGGYSEAQVNLAVAQRVVALLASRGMAVDLLPATIPPGYDADAFVAIHADGSPSTSNRGFKLATPWRTSQAAQHLLDSLADEYASATGLPLDTAVTFNMRGYYAFNFRRHTHAIARTTPAVILEMGFLTNSADRAIMIDQADRVAIGVANGIVRYLNERDPNDGAALLPPDFKTQRPISPAGLDVYAAPSDQARVLEHIDADGRFFVFQERDGWYQGVIRGKSRLIGWVRKDQVTATNDPLPTPAPATDS